PRRQGPQSRARGPSRGSPHGTVAQHPPPAPDIGTSSPTPNGTCSPKPCGCLACTLPSIHFIPEPPRSQPPKGVGFPDPLSGTLKFIEACAAAHSCLPAKGGVGDRECQRAPLGRHSARLSARRGAGAVFLAMVMASPAGFGRVHFGPAATPERDRIGVWREVIGRSVLRLDISPLPDVPFEAEVTLQAMPGLAMLS